MQRFRLDFLYTMANDIQTSDIRWNLIYCFWTMIRHRPLTTGLTVQAGIFVNPAITTVEPINSLHNSRYFRPEYDPATKQCYFYPKRQHPQNLASKSPPGSGNGNYIINQPASPNRNLRLKLPTSAAWATSPADLTFNYNNLPYATKISEYKRINTPLTVKCVPIATRYCTNNLLKLLNETFRFTC